jgi:hypothetical protein
MSEERAGVVSSPKNNMEGESETSGLIGWKFRGRDEEKFPARTATKNDIEVERYKTLL